MPDLKREIPRTMVFEILAGIAFLLWRVWVMLLTGDLLDWGFILVLYWFFCIAASGKRIWAPVTTVFTVGLLLVYAKGQLPHAFSALALSP